MPLIFQERITPDDLSEHPDRLFLFGDNERRAGSGGQARVCRGRPNSIGIATKRSPERAEGAYWSNAEYDRVITIIAYDLTPAIIHLVNGGTFVCPSAGLGTGLSELPTRARQVLNYLRRHIVALKRIGHAPSACGCQVGFPLSDRFGWEADSRRSVRRLVVRIVAARHSIGTEGLCGKWNVNLETAKTLISATPRRRPDKPTLMELSGYPHYENVASNILAFYLDPAEVHGLGSLLLDALLHLLDPDARGPLSNVNVDREAGTSSVKKLDILITSDSHILAIENKIFAKPYNPFQEYAKLVDSQAENRKVFKRVLGLFAPSGEIGHGFAFLSYKPLINKVRSKLGHHTRGADARYTLFLLDFLDTVENLQRGTRMDKEWINFIGEQYDNFLALEKQIGAFKYEMHLKVEELSGLIVVPVPVEHKFWREKAYLQDTVYYEIKNPDDLIVVVEGTISPKGWLIEIFPRKQEEEPLSRVIELTRSLEIPFLQVDYDGSRRLTYQPQFSYDEPVGTVGLHLQAVLDKIIGCFYSDETLPITTHSTSLSRIPAPPPGPP